MNVELSDAIKEAYATAPTDTVIVETIEWLHPSFVDGSGNPASYRIAVNQPDCTCTLEGDAPMDGGDPVLFTGMAVEYSKPEITPEMDVRSSIVVDNVGGFLLDGIERAADDGSPVTQIYREFLWPALDTVHRKITMTLQDVVLDNYRVKGTLVFRGMASRKFGIPYTLEKFPGIAE